jgi:hypothetical protein
MAKCDIVTPVLQWKNVMTKHRIYIDEVGNPDLESSDDPNHRFLSLTGVIHS